MKNISSKIVLFFLFGLIIYSCSEVRKISKKEILLHQNEIIVNGKKSTSEDLLIQLYQKPNSKLLGFKPRLQIFNLASKNPDSSYNSWLNKKPYRIARMNKIYSKRQVDRLGNSFLVAGYSKMFKNIGEAPVILDTTKITKSKKRLYSYYKNRGYFKTTVQSRFDTLDKQKVKVTYTVNTSKPFLIDSIFRDIKSPVVDSMFVAISNKSLLKSGNPYNKEQLKLEKERITTNFRNNGLFYFQENYIKHDIDTIDKDNSLSIITRIQNRNIKRNDSLVTEPFELYRIKKVNIFTEKQYKEKAIGIDSTLYKNYNFYSSGNLKYKPKALLNAIFIENNDLFSDEAKTLTTKVLSNLRLFKFPKIQYIVDTINNTLTTNIILTPEPKYKFNLNTDFTHSNIQDFGISGYMGITFRNVFRGAEVLDLSTRGNIGTSNDNSIKSSTNAFFNILEYGADVKLSIPRILFPINTKRIIKKTAFPTSTISLGLSKQTNIGLDKENYNGNIFYDWGLNLDNTKKFKFELFNLQFVRNLNIENYFKVYSYSYNTLNELAQFYTSNVEFYDANKNLKKESALEFMNQVLNFGIPVSNEIDFKTINTIAERRQRLIENNLILSSSFSYNLNSRKDINDKEFYNIKAKVETAGNLIGAIAKSVKEKFSDSGNRTLFGVEYAQYIKTELEYIKHLHLNKNSSFAFRFFGGIAIPYGNATTIPFSRSYFAGGSNDNRGWQAYSLGPGASKSLNDFNDANLKLSLNLEYRFNIFGSLKGAIFNDFGNIWNAFYKVTDEKLTFNGIKSLKNTAIGSGFGFRYDFNFFVIRTDFGFKTYNPSRETNQRWFKDVNIKESVFNIGINYPF